MFNVCPFLIFFFNIECTNVDVIFVSDAQNSRDLIQPRFKPRPTYASYMFLKKYSSKTFVGVNVS